MGKIWNLIKTGLLAGSLLFGGMKANSQSNVLSLRVIDPIMKFVDSTQIGLANYPVRLEDRLTGYTYNALTNPQGYVDFITSIDENKYVQVKDFFNVFKDQRGVNFQYNSNGNSLIKIYDVLGKEVKEIRHENNNYGLITSTWDLRNNKGIDVSAGVYPFRVFNDGNLISGGTVNYVKGLGFVGWKGKFKGNPKKEFNSNLSKSNQVFRYRLSIDGTAGNFFNVVQEEDSLHHFSGSGLRQLDSSHVYEMMYKWPFTHPVFPNFLEFFKYSAGSDTTFINKPNGEQILLNWLKDQLPLELFKNSGTAPLPVFNQALNDYEDTLTTRINKPYHNGTISNLIPFQEVSNYTFSGINMDYTTTFAHTTRIWNSPPQNSGLSRGPPINARVYVNKNSTDYLSIIDQIGYEHLVYAVVAGNPGREPITPEPGWPINENRVNLVIIEWGSKEFTNLSLYTAESL